MLKKKTYISFLLLLMMVAIFAPVKTQAKIKLNAKSKTLTVGKTCKLKVKGTKKKVKWSSTKKSVATVTKKGKVKAKKAGKCTIKAKVAGKTLKCKITVKNSSDLIKILPLDSNYDLLVKEIKKSANKDSDGNPYITNTSSADNGNRTTTDTLTYVNSSQKLKFVTTTKIGSATQTASMFYGKSDTTQATVTITYKDSLDNYTATGQINPSTFNDSVNITFNVQGTVSDSSTPQYVQQLSNSGMKVMLAGANNLGLKQAGVGLKDIGFSKY